MTTKNWDANCNEETWSLTATTEVWSSLYDSPDYEGKWVGCELLGTYENLSAARRAAAQFKKNRCANVHIVQYGERLTKSLLRNLS